MKNKKSGKLSSEKVNSKKKQWKIFSKENLKWGLGGVVVFSLVSVALLNIPCESYSPLILSICLSQIIFITLNLIGTLIAGTIFLNKPIISNNTYFLLSIIFNIPIYYFIGIGFKKLIDKIKK